MALVDINSAVKGVADVAKKTVEAASVVSGLQAGAGALDALKGAVSAGAGGLVSGLTNALAGQIQGIAEVVRQIEDFNPEQLIQQDKTIDSIPGTAPFPNALHNYASFNYIWTLSVLSPQDLNFPDESYRKGKLGPILLKSGSGNPNDRVATAYKSQQNPEGKFDYYIDDVRVNGTMGMDKVTGNTNATGLSFKIIEPYSMGLFFQSLQIAALEAGYFNWLDVPLLLRLEFFGHIDQYKQNVQIPGTTRFFPLKIMDIKMNVTGQGSTYSCEAIPWNEKAHSTTYSQVKTDINVSGSTVQEMLQTGEKSLQKVVNDVYLEKIKRKEVDVPDQILILFPADLKTSDATGITTDSANTPGATVNPTESGNNQNVLNRLGVVRGTDGFNLIQNDNINPIGIANMGFNEYRKGENPFGKDNAVYDEKTGTYKRGNITISKTVSEAKFAQGTDIPNVINQIILASDYGRQALDPDKVSEDGFISWWKIETQMYILDSDSNIEKTGRKPNLVVYRVIPHRVHHSRFMAPNQPAKGTEKLNLEAIKEYNYLYTGKNLDILEFGIEFNTGFYTATSADSGKNNIDVKQTSKTGGLAVSNEQLNDNRSTETFQRDPITGIVTDTSGTSGGSAAPKIGLGTIPTSSFQDKIRSDSGNKGGPRSDDPATLAARQFHDAITNAADMIELNMKILGDPFFLGDSGMGNYSAQATNFKGLTGDGTINNQDGEVYIRVNFRNPVDLNNYTGRFDFPGGGLVPQFSGLYRVSIVENRFTKGQFTQDLTLTRMVGQDIKDDGTAGKTLISKIADAFNPNDKKTYTLYNTAPGSEQTAMLAAQEAGFDD
jgi:hypothetical protein